MAQARLGTDWIFIGLGAGALYLLYKMNKGAETVGSSIGQTTSNVSDALAPWLKNVEMIGRLPEIIGTKLNSKKPISVPMSANTPTGKIQAIETIQKISQIKGTPSFMELASKPVDINKFSQTARAELANPMSATNKFLQLASGTQAPVTVTTATPSTTTKNVSTGNKNVLSSKSNIKIVPTQKPVQTKITPVQTVKPGSKISPFTGRAFA